MRNTLLILAALSLGLLFPALGDYTGIIRPNLMLMLFFSFAKADLSWKMFRGRHLALTLPAPLIAVAAFFLLRDYELDLALNLFLVFIAPAAVITPVLVDLMRRDVPYAIGGVLITHAVWAVLIALLLPVVTGVALTLPQLTGLLLQVSITIGVPLAAALVWRYIGGRLLSVTIGLSRFSIYLFVLNIFIASARLSQYIRYEAAVEWSFLLLVAGGVVIGGLLLFLSGYLAGRRGWRPEASLLVGRKNTMLSIWIALTYLSPLITIGPMLYILFQNVLFVGQLRAWGKDGEHTEGEAASEDGSLHSPGQ